MEEKLIDYMSPDKVTKKRHLGQPIYIINFDIEEVIVDEVTQYAYYTVELPPAVWDYGVIVDKIITTYYPNDKMWAILNNYMLDQSDEQNLQEYNAMQERRAWAKQTAKDLMAYAEENGIIEHSEE